MEINFNSISKGFFNYLKKKNLLQNSGNKLNIGANIYNYAKEFESYINSTFTNGLTSQNISIMDIVNYDDNTKNNNNNAEELLNKTFDELMNNEEFFKTIDTDKNGKISNGEKKSFFESIKNLDGNSNNFTISDLLFAADSIKENAFVQQDNDSNNPSVNINNNDNTQKNSNTNNNNKINTNTKKTNTKQEKSETTNLNEIPDKKSLKNMSKSELQSELKSSEKEYSDGKKELNMILNGSNPTIKGLSENVDNKYNEYKEALEKKSPEMATQLDKIVTDISSQEKKIDDTQKNVYNYEIKEKDTKSQISILTKNSNNKKELYDAVKSSLKSINKKEQPEVYKELQKQVKNAKSEYENTINKLNEEKRSLEKIIKDKNEAEKNLRDEKAKLKELNDSKAEFEKSILNDDTSEIGKLMSEYNNAKAELNKTKSELTVKAKAKVDQAQKRRNDVKEQLANKNREAPLFLDKNSKISMKYINDGKTMPYLLIGPENPQENLPMVVYLHGGNARDSSNARSSSQNTGPAGVMRGRNWKLDNFNGYIVCPVRTGKYSASWASDQGANNVKNLIDTFTKEHSVNKSKIALAGHSLGGMGTTYIAGKLKGTFCKAAALSPSRTVKYDPSDLGIPYRVYVGTDDGKNCMDVAKSYKGKMNSKDIIWYKGISHGGVPRVTISEDTNNNGHSDFLEWLFS